MVLIIEEIYKIIVYVVRVFLLSKAAILMKGNGIIMFHMVTVNRNLQMETFIKDYISMEKRKVKMVDTYGITIKILLNIKENLMMIICMVQVNYSKLMDNL